MRKLIDGSLSIRWKRRETQHWGTEIQLLRKIDLESFDKALSRRHQSPQKLQPLLRLD